MDFESGKCAVKPKINVLPALISHAPSILNVTREAFIKYVREAEIPNSIDALNETVLDIEKDIREKKVFIAEVDGVLCGSIRINVNSERKAYISRFGVLTDYQSLGVGRALVEEVMKYLEEIDVHTTILHTAANYSNLVRFYNQLGFTIQEITYDRGYPRALMKKEH